MSLLKLISALLFFLIVNASNSLAEDSSKNHVRELTCSDNATCINTLTDEIVKGVKENKTLKIFDFLTIEPVAPVVETEGRSNEGPISKFLNTHALKFDLGTYGVSIVRSARTKPSIIVSLEDNKGRGGTQKGLRRKGTKVVQAILPLMLGVKSASTTLVAIGAVTLLVFKAFMASKLALMVSLVLAAKKLLESFKGVVPPPNVYPAFPIDYHNGPQGGFSIPQGVYASPDIYGMSSVGHQGQDLLQSQAAAHSEPIYDAIGHGSAIHEINVSNITNNQYSQPAAGKRWDGFKKKPMYYNNPPEYRYQEK